MNCIRAILFLRFSSALYSISLLFIFAIFLTGCLGPKKIDKWVAKQYGSVVPDPVKKKSDYLMITSPLTPAGDRVSTTEKNTSHMLPLIVYWQFDYKNTCTLNPQIPVNTFTSTALSYNSKILKQKLNGGRVELSINKIPNKFALDDKGHIIWIILYAITWEYITIQPDINEMEVSYKVFASDNSEVKSGVITVPNSDKGVSLKLLQSIKKMTGQYLDDYNACIAQMSKKVIDKLITEL